MQKTKSMNIAESRLRKEAEMADKEATSKLNVLLQKSNSTKNSSNVSPFIHLASPIDRYTFYFLIFRLDHEDFRGGIYLGEIVCPPEYPLAPPTINLLTENGRFKPSLQHGICMSMSKYHPETWQPTWNVATVILGLVSFWIDTKEPYTQGAINQSMVPDGLKLSEWRRKLAGESLETIKAHPIYQNVFKDRVQEDLETLCGLEPCLERKMSDWNLKSQSQASEKTDVDMEDLPKIGVKRNFQQVNKAKLTGNNTQQAMAANENNSTTPESCDSSDKVMSPATKRRKVVCHSQPAAKSTQEDEQHSDKTVSTPEKKADQEVFSDLGKNL